MRFAVVALGESHLCGLTSDGRAYCWGNNSSGQLGDGTLTSAGAPRRVIGGLRFKSLSTWANSQTCGIATTAEVYCWGLGPAGNGTNGSLLAPTRVSGNITWSRLMVGNGHVCGTSSARDVYCWGNNAVGQLGDSTTCFRGTPKLIRSGTGNTIARVAVGASATCVVQIDGEALCSGYAEALTGTGGNRVVVAPTPLAKSVPFVAVALGESFGCGLVASGSMYCWGRNDIGSVGDGTFDARRESAVPVVGGIQFKLPP